MHCFSQCLPVLKLQEPCVFTPDNGAELKTAVNAYIDNPSSAIITYGLINSWCVGNVVDMSNLFQYKTTFNEDISAWDTSSVTTMSQMFFGAGAFIGDISNWNTSSVIIMERMFVNAIVFNGNLSNWDTSSVINLQYMFYGASLFNGDISNWDTSSVTNMNYMFQGASAFNQDLCAWGDKFPYSTSLDIFTGSACTFIAQPNSAEQGPFCASACVSCFSSLVFY